MGGNKKKKNKGTETVADSLNYFFKYLIHCMLCVYILLILIILPFYFEEGYSHIGTDKSYFFRQVSTVGWKLLLPVLLCYLVSAAVVWRQNRKKEAGNNRKNAFWNRISVTDVFAGMYGIGLLISYACSDYKKMALWGADGWFMGLYPQLILIGVYFLISRFWIPQKWMFYLFLPVSGVVFFLGYLNRFGIYPIDMQVENIRFISTIGNINWYCGYLVTVFFGGVFLLWQEAWHGVKPPLVRLLVKVLLILYVAVGFSTLVTHGSSSGILTMAVMLLVFFFLSASDSRRMLGFWQMLLILSAVCTATFFIRRIFPDRFTYNETTTELLTNSVLPFLMAGVSVVFFIWVFWSGRKGCYPERFFRILTGAAVFGALAAVLLLVILICSNTLNPGSLGKLSKMSIFTFSPGWGSNRGATWTAGVMCFGELSFWHKLVGVGPDCMTDFLYRDGSQALNTLVVGSFGRDRLTNAHNEWLTILVNGGIWGLVSYVGMVISAVMRYIKRRNVNYIAAAAGFCLLAYTVNNMFSFQQAMNVSAMFIIFGIGEAYVRKE